MLQTRISCSLPLLLVLAISMGDTYAHHDLTSETVPTPTNITGVRASPSADSVHQNTESAKRKLHSDDTKSWRRIADAQLTPNGDWLVYRLITHDASTNTDAIVVLRSTLDGTERRHATSSQHFEGTNELQLSYSGNWVAFKSARQSSHDKQQNQESVHTDETTLTLVDLVSGRKLVVPNVHS